MKRVFSLLILILAYITHAQAQTVLHFSDNKLSAMKEPVLYTDKSKKEAYRFTWLRSFHPAVVVRIEKQQDTYRLYWKLLDNKTGDERLMIDTQKTINHTVWDQFKFKLKQAGFWRMTTKEAPIFDANGNQQYMLDGAEWVLEAKTADKYQVVYRQSPDKTSPYYQCCDYLLVLTGMQISESDKY